MVEMLPTVINGRWTLALPRHRAERPQWDIVNGGWETARLADMHDWITSRPAGEHEPPHVLDVGAEEGDMPALYAMWGARVTCVEPNPLVWPNIRVIFEANSLPTPDWFVGFCGAPDDVRAFDDRQSDAHFDGWPACAHGPVIGDHGFLQLAERPDVSSTTVDALADRFGRFDAITMDVEGSELHVIRGADRTLADHRPVVWVAIHPTFMADQYGQDPSALHDLMGRAGYVGRLLDWKHEQHFRFDPAETL